MSEPTTERGAWLEPIKRDLEYLAGPRNMWRPEISRRVYTEHAPAMQRALEVVEALQPEKSYRPAWEEGYAACLRDVRQAIDEARSES